MKPQSKKKKTPKDAFTHHRSSRTATARPNEWMDGFGTKQAKLKQNKTQHCQKTNYKQLKKSERYHHRKLPPLYVHQHIHPLPP
jgi:hypothetical protein